MIFNQMTLTCDLIKVHTTTNFQMQTERSKQERKRKNKHRSEKQWVKNNDGEIKSNIFVRMHRQLHWDFWMIASEMMWIVNKKNTQEEKKSMKPTPYYLQLNLQWAWAWCMFTFLGVWVSRLSASFYRTKCITFGTPRKESFNICKRLITIEYITTLLTFPVSFFHSFFIICMYFFF